MPARSIEGPVRDFSHLVHLDQRHDSLVSACMRTIGGSAVRGFMEANRGEGRPSFAIPTELEPQLKRSPRRFRV